MSPGLLRLIELIKERPSDVVLVDRFIVLANEASKQDRADALLRVAKILVSKSPMRAIEIAFQEFKAGVSMAPHIATIIEALVVLKNPEKSTLIRKEMMRYWDQNLSGESKQLARLAIEEHVSRILSEAEKLPARQFWGETTKTNFESLGGAGVETAAIDAASIDAASIDAASIDAAAIDARAVPVAEAVVDQSLLKTVLVPSVAAAQPLPASESADVGRARVPRELASRRGVEARVSVASHGAGIPEIIPPRNESRHALGILERVSGRASNAGAAAESRVAESRGMSKDESIKFLNDRIMSEDWDTVLEQLNKLFSLADDLHYLLGIFERKKLFRIDLRFAAWWVDILVAARQERRALRYIQQMLLDDPIPAWARMGWPKIQLIRNRLELTHIEWQESDGVAALRERLTDLRPRLGCYWMAPTKVP